MAIKTLRVFQEFTSEGYVPMPPAGNIDYGYTIAGTFPSTTPATFQTDDPDIDVTVTEMTDFYVWIRSHGAEWNINYTRNVRVYPDSPLINNVVMGIIIANFENALPSGGTTGQILAKIDNTDYNAQWIDNYADWTSQLKHEVKAGVALTKGQAVYVSSADGTNMIVSKASNASESTSSKTLGLVAQNLALNGKGFVITEGLLSGLNTSSATVGDAVWLGTDGNLIYGLANKPVAPAHLVFIGIVTRVNNSNGEIFIKVQNGFELREIHDVLITSPTNNQGLLYDSASTLWKNANIQLPISLTNTGSSGASTFVGNVLNIPNYTLVGLGGVPTTRTITINGTTYDLSADRTWTISSGTVTSVAATVPTGFAISGSPITTSGTLAITFASGYSLPTDAKQAQWDTAYNKRIMTASMPLQIDLNNISIYQSSPTSNGYLSSTDWTTFNNKQNALNGSGFVKASGTTITYDNSTYVPTSRTLTINGVTFDLSANRSWTVGSELTASAPLSITGGVISISQANNTTNGFLSSTDWATFNAKQSALSGSGFVKVSGTTISYDNTAYTPTSRLLTINGTSYDLSADRSWTITPGSGMRNIQTFTATSGQTTFTITGGYTVGLVDVFVNGARLSSSDFTATNGTTVVLGVGVVANDIVDVINYTASLTSGITGSGTVNYLPLWAGSSNLTNSLISQSGTTITANGLFKANGIIASMGGGLYAGSGYQLVFADYGSPEYASIEGSSFSTTFCYLRFIINGAEKMRINSTGVGINTSSPRAALDVSGNLYANSVWIPDTTGSLLFGNLTTGASGTYIYGVGGDGVTNYLGFATNASEKMRILANGNVGIGTASPSQKLDVNGAIKSLGDYYALNNTPFSTNGTITVHDTVGLVLKGITSFVFDFAIYSTGTIGSPLLVNPTGTTNMNFPTGNVGIGLTPTEKLSVNGNIKIDNGAADGGQLILASSGFSDWNIDNFSGSLRAYYGSTEYIRLSSTGNLSIGNTNNTYKLDVSGTARFTGQFNLTNSNKIYSDASSAHTYHQFNRNTATGYEQMIMWSTGGSPKWYVGLQANTSDGFGIYGEAAGANAITIKADNKVGIGTLTPLTKLDVNGTSLFYGDIFTAINGGVFFQGNATYGSGIYSRDSGLSLILQAGSSERMRISSAGKVGIGTSNPTEKLNVYTNELIWGIQIQHAYTSGTQFYMNFLNSTGGQTGSIMGNGSSTSYNTTSDYRLKQDIKPFNGLDIVKKINTYDYEWKYDNSRSHGVLAHELQEILPYAVFGEKDGKQIQQVDYSKIVPVLVQAIKELNAKLEAK